MITVTILINGQPLFTRSARNTLVQNDEGQFEYAVDTGQRVYHARDEGAVHLAKLLLDTIREEEFE